MHFTMLMRILKQMLHLVVTIVVSISWISVFMVLSNLSRSETHEPIDESIDYRKVKGDKSYFYQEFPSILTILFTITIFMLALAFYRLCRRCAWWKKQHLEIAILHGIFWEDKFLAICKK